MNKTFYLLLLTFFIAQCMLTGCDGQQSSSSENKSGENNSATPMTTPKTYKEGSDFILFERVRILDNTAFTQPAEAYSLLLPIGWQQQSNIIWNMPGSSCAGTFKELYATSTDGKYSFRMFPDMVYSWNTDPQLMQFYQNNSSGNSFCAIGQPLNAEQYLRKVFGPTQLGNPQIQKVESNPLVVEEMQQANEMARTELMQYGAANIAFDQTAVNATLRWPNGTEGLVVFGVTVVENTVPNVYNGTYNKSYTTQVMKRIVFTYPATESKQAVNQFGVIMASFRTNPSWNETVNNYWKQVRQQKQVAHIGKLKLMDAQTKAIGEAAIKSGQERLKAMDSDMRSWEQRQDAQDRMHTNFIKTIREVENYQDETGKIELASGYNHAWSRGDGSTFIMSNDPSFNPGSVFLDQNWKEMKKVD